VNSLRAIEALVNDVRRRVGSTTSVTSIRQSLADELTDLTEGLVQDPAARQVWGDGTDILGTAYEQLLPATARRPKGQFQTPFWAADLMARWLLGRPTKTLFDPAVGTGRLLFRAFEHGQHQPNRFVGWDVDELCVLMGALNMRLRQVPGYSIERANFLLDNDALKQAGLLDDPPDATICNPPFSRHQLLDAATKDAIHRNLQEVHGIEVSRRAGLHALFLVRALALAAPGGRLAFITPAGWLDADYGQAVKAYIDRHASLEAMVIFGERKFFFDGAQTTAAITLLKNEPCDAPTRLIRLGAELPEIDEVLGTVRGAKTDIKVQETVLRPAARWSRPSVRLPQGTPLEELALVRRGIATGHNRFFVISESRRSDLGLREHDLLPCLYRPRVVPELEIGKRDLDALDDDVPRWLLNAASDQKESNDDPLGRYLKTGLELGVNKRYLARKRKCWFRLEQRGNCEIVLPYMHRNTAWFIRNRAGAVPLNTFHVIEPYDPEQADQLWEALNELTVLRQLRRLGREYGNGLWKIEPGDLRRVRVEL